MVEFPCSCRSPVGFLSWPCGVVFFFVRVLALVQALQVGSLVQWTGFVRYGAMHSASKRQSSPPWHQCYVLSMRVRRNHGPWQGVFFVVFVPVVRGALQANSGKATSLGPPLPVKSLLFPCHSYVAFRRTLGSRGCGMWCKRFSVLFFLA